MKVLILLIFINIIYFVLGGPNYISSEILNSSEEEFVKEIFENETEEFESDDAVSKKVILNLYRRSDPDYPYALDLDTINNAPINNNLSTEIIIHGWLNSGDSTWVLRMKDKYFLNSDHNIIIVDWSGYAQLGYIYASNKVEKSGNYVAQVLTPLIESGKLDTENIHIIGHCLGGHMAGFIGKYTQRNLERNIGRITGLDVARHLYEFPMMISEKKRLVKGDALFVDIIHACGGDYGFKSVLGHADFYPNGGTSRQPGCLILTPLSCSRMRSVEYYTESINTNNFKATPCDSWKHYKKGKCDGAEPMIMGFHIDVNAAAALSGSKYYLRTNKREPYSKG